MDSIHDTNYYLDKLMKMAEEFDELYVQKEYGRANWVYIRAQVIALFLELPQETRSRLFGYWPDDGTDDPDDPVPPGLFDVDKARKVGWHCCVKQNKTYQDVANRRMGRPDDVQYYSDEDYCTFKCWHASPRHLEQIQEMTG